MANPVNNKSLDGVSSNTDGSGVRSRAHYHLTLFVSAASNLDTAGGDTFTVELQGSPDGTDWDTIDDDQGNALQITESDVAQVGGAGAFTASLTHRGAYYEHYRVRLSNFNDAASSDLTVDAWIMAGGNAGQGVRGNPDG